MIITRLTGGLGNQMFQYAAGLALAELRRTTCSVDPTWFAAEPGLKNHERFALDHFFLQPQVAGRAEIDRAHGRKLDTFTKLARILKRRLGLPVPGVAYDGDFSFDPAFFRHPNGTYLHGNWQSELYFAGSAAAVRRHFAFVRSPPAAFVPLLERLAASPSVCVHFRRGDYVSEPFYARENGALGHSYYTRAIALVRSHEPSAKLFVFSDDIETVSREFIPDGTHEFVREPAGIAPHETLRLMSSCRHFITANSTLSWWAAWLAAAQGKIVVAPEPWFAGGTRNGADIVPKAWRRLSRDV